ncbi:MAG TPA: M56 family metallopeptidase [Candidatus Angelobacter sp.]|nr:M56 family metallopeptidase [Candidatus Angelobacter sp.]
MNPVNEMVVTYVTNALWMTCVIAAVTVLLSRALRRGPASHRHALWVAALLLAVLLPFASLRGSGNNDKPRPESGAAANTVQPAEKGFRGASSWALWRGMRHGGHPVQFGAPWVRFVALLYFGFIFHRAVRLFRGWQSLRAMLRKSSEPQMPPAMRTVVEQCHSLLGMRPVPILLSLEGKGPATMGIHDPVLVLPEWFFSQASEDELSSVLGHELAHIRRHDFFLNLVYELFLLPICFHPAAALIKSRIDQTRELACDEIATECLSTGTRYARSLLSIAQSMAAKQRPATVGYALGLFDTNTLEDRIMHVLAKANRLRKIWARALALGALGLLITACLGVSGFSVQVTQPHNADANLQPFVGTWQATFKGKIFQTIKLEKKRDKLTGTVKFHADIKVDPKSGELTDVEVLDGSDVNVEAILTNGILRITETEEDALQFDMKVTGADQAQLQIVVPADVAGDVPTPKPWKLERAKSGPSTL